MKKDHQKLTLERRCQAFRFSVDSTASYSLTFLSKYDFNLEDESKIISERYGLTVRDFEDTYAAQSQANAWSVVYK